MGDGRRIARVEKEVHNVIADYIIHYLSREIEGLVTITRVIMAGDLRTGKVYVSILLPDGVNSLSEEKKSDKQDEIVEFLNSRAYAIQDELSHKLNMRYVPKLKFFLDETLDKVLRIERIISDLKINSEDDDQSK